jgi:hypothetical protein
MYEHFRELVYVWLHFGVSLGLILLLNFSTAALLLQRPQRVVIR